MSDAPTPTSNAITLKTLVIAMAATAVVAGGISYVTLGGETSDLQSQVDTMRKQLSKLQLGLVKDERRHRVDNGPAKERVKATMAKRVAALEAWVAAVGSDHPDSAASRLAQLEKNEEKIADAAVALREDVDVLLDSEGNPIVAQGGQPAGAKTPTPGDEDEEADEADEEDEEEEAPEAPKVQEPEPDGAMWTREQRRVERGWVERYAEMAGLSDDKADGLMDLVSDYRARQEEAMDRGLDGGNGHIDAQIAIRELRIETKKRLRDLLNQDEINALRRAANNKRVLFNNF